MKYDFVVGLIRPINISAEIEAHHFFQVAFFLEIVISRGGFLFLEWVKLFGFE